MKLRITYNITGQISVDNNNIADMAALQERLNNIVDQELKNFSQVHKFTTSLNGSKLLGRPRNKAVA